MWKLMITAALIVPAACAPRADNKTVGAEVENPYILAAATGEPERCLPRARDIQSTKGLSRKFMLFRMRGGDLYRAEFSNSCPGSGFDEAFSRTSPVASFCTGEILTFFDPQNGTPFGSCTINSFTPIEDPKKTTLADE